MKIHIVKIGETLYGLAKKYGIELAKLIALNPHIVNPDEIQAGQKVKIPTAPKPLEPPEGTYTFKHVVKQGDSLWKLSKAWDIPLAALIAANPQLKNPNVLLTGEFVYIPKKTSEQSPEPLPDVEMPAVPHDASIAPHQPDADSAPPLYGEMPSVPSVPSVPQWSPMEVPGMHAEAEEPQYQFEPLQSQAPLLSEPFGGLQGWEAPAVHPFTQEYVPATEAFAHTAAAQKPYFQQFPQYGSGQQFPQFALSQPYPQYPPFGQGQQQQSYPQFPQLPNEPFEHFLQSAYGGTPYPAHYPAVPVMPPYEMPMTAYPHTHTGDCGCGHGHSHTMLPYAAPTGMPYPPAAPYMEAPSYGELPNYPYPHPHLHAHEPAHWDGLKLEETEKVEDLDVTISDSGDKRGSLTKPAAGSGKKAKSPRSQLEAYVNQVRHHAPDTKRQRPNTPWINV